MGTKRVSDFQPHPKTGKQRTVPTSPGMFNARDHENISHQSYHGDVLGRGGGKPKTGAGIAAPIHGQMYSRTRDGMHVQGVTQTSLANAPDASCASPLDPTVMGKRLTQPAIMPGMRSRTSDARGDMLADLGKRILAEAVRTR